jgi:putative SOS response-associated peptidase YedK
VNAIFPRHVAPIVRQSEDGEREIVLMSWGFMRLEKGRAPRPVTNVRDDQIRTNLFWRDSFQKRRCLVPASSFCEPQRRREAGHLELVRPQGRRRGRCSRSQASGDTTRDR